MVRVESVEAARRQRRLFLSKTELGFKRAGVNFKLYGPADGTSGPYSKTDRGKLKRITGSRN